MSTHGLSKFFILGVIVIALVGCQATRRGLNLDTSAAVHIRVDHHVNPDLDDRSSPIMLQVFKLADARQFEREDFLNLYENPVDRLGKDLLGALALKELVPGEYRIETLPLTPDVRYVGFLAEYMQHDRASAVLVVPVQEHRKNIINLNLRYLSLVDTDNPDSARNTRLAPSDQYPSQPRSRHGADNQGQSGTQGQSADHLPTYRNAQQTVENVQKEREFWQRATSK